MKAQNQCSRDKVILPEGATDDAIKAPVFSLTFHQGSVFAQSIVIPIVLSIAKERQEKVKGRAA